jgi:ATP-dependent RNA helicase RhlE
MPESADFSTLSLNPHLQRAVRDAGYTEPTPIQIQTIPQVLAGRDVVGCAQTRTGKTAAIALPILQILATNTPQAPQGKAKGTRKAGKEIRVLVLSPTRELAIQIADFFTEYGQFIPRLTNAVVFGGVKASGQIQALAKGVDILVATPGRLLDLMGQGFIALDRVEHLVLDEADRLLDMGFIHDIRKILKMVTHPHQTLLFSATMPPEIVKLARDFLRNPVRVSVTPEQPTVELIEQAVYFVPSKTGKQTLLQELLADPAIARVLVFSRTKHGANTIVRKLRQAGFEADPIHGNKSQNARQMALENFREGRTRILVATDVAARGIDVEDISHVIQFDLPNEPETYVHRIGRTGRAGADGIAISFCTDEERPLLQAIQKLIRLEIPVVRSTSPGTETSTPASAPQRSPAARPAKRSEARSSRKSTAANNTARQKRTSGPRTSNRSNPQI